MSFQLPVFVKAIRQRLGAQSLAHRLTSGVFWTLLGNTTLRAFSALATVILARMLGPERLGELGIIESTVAMFAVYGAFRLGNTAIRFVSKYRMTDPLRAQRILNLSLIASFGLCAIVALTVALAADAIAVRNLRRPDLADDLRMGALMLFYLTYGNVMQQALMGFEDFRSTARLNTYRGMLTPLLCIPMAYFFGVPGAIGGLTAGAAVIFPVVALAITRNARNAGLTHSIPVRELRHEVPVLWSFALPGFLVFAITTVVMWVSRVMLTRQPQGYADMGIFQAASAWNSLIVLIPTNVARVMLPILSRAHGEESSGEFRKAFGLQTEAVWMISIPMAICIIGFSRPLALIFGRDYAAVEGILPTLIISAVFLSANEGIRIVYESMARQWTNLLMYAVWGIVLLVACAVLTKGHGIMGFCIANLIANACLFALQAVYVDTRLVPGALRPHFMLISFGLVLFIASMTAVQLLPRGAALAANALLFLIALFPVGLRLKNKLRPRPAN